MKYIFFKYIIYNLYFSVNPILCTTCNARISTVQSAIPMPLRPLAADCTVLIWDGKYSSNACTIYGHTRIRVQCSALHVSASKTHQLDESIFFGIQLRRQQSEQVIKCDQPKLLKNSTKLTVKCFTNLLLKLLVHGLIGLVTILDGVMLHLRESSEAINWEVWWLMLEYWCVFDFYNCQFLWHNLVRCRDCHGYGKTRGFEVMGFVGTGTVVNFGTLQHTTA